MQRNTEQILIKDPYLTSTFKDDSKYSGLNHSLLPKREVLVEGVDHSKWKIQQDMKNQLERTQNQFRRMARAYTSQNKLNKKILDFQAVNTDYHEGLKLRNLDLNNKLNEVVTNTHLLNNKFESDYARNFHEKDMLLRKYQIQAEELLQARKTINNLIQHKTKLEEQIQHMTFLLQTQADRFNLEMRQQALRMEGLQRTIKNITEAKDQEIIQLRHRIRIYEDQNKKLNHQNRTLNITLGSQKQRQRGQKDRDRQRQRQRDKQNRAIDNLSQINHTDSAIKEGTIHKQFQQQKQINQKLQKELEELKKNLFKKDGNKQKNAQIVLANPNSDLSPDKPNGLLNSVQSLRGGINKQVFDIFYKSVKDGEKHRSNSLVIFIENWKNIDLGRMEPFVKSYFETRSNLQQIYESGRFKGKPINASIEECIPLHISHKKGRSQISSWILATIQQAKQQRESSKKSLNNLLLFLFRLLTIRYRINYPMQGKSYSVDVDVQNELNHEIAKSVNYIIEFC